jgi:hypothetical protein
MTCPMLCRSAHEIAAVRVVPYPSCRSGLPAHRQPSIAHCGRAAKNRPSPHRGCRPCRRSGRPSAPGRAIRPRALPRPLGRRSLAAARDAQCPLTVSDSCL